MTEDHASDRSVYVAMTGLASDANEQELRAMLHAYGPVLSYSRPTDPNTGRIGATAYAEMAPSDAQAAIRALDGQERKGRLLTVSVAAQPTPDMEPADRRVQGSNPRRTVLAPSLRPARPILTTPTEAIG